MHQLTRGASPTCLGSYQHSLHGWKDVRSTDKQQIWLCLTAMQQQRCAYCECSLSPATRHIEHFVQRSHDPSKTFAWTNLFGSCNRDESCGMHKDAKGLPYSDADVIKPDSEDPERLLVFDPHGGISPRAGLSPADHRRATETIRVFNLNGVLKAIRRSEVMGYVQTAEQFEEMAATFPPADWLPLLEEEVEKIRELPFATAIKHVLTNQS